MPLPTIVTSRLLPLGALAPVGAPTPTPSPPIGGASVSASALSFTMHMQEQTNWCWSAVSVSVAQFYDPGTAWTSQCDLAGKELGASCCPAGTSPETCNVPWYLDRALSRVGHYNTFGNGPATTSQIGTEIDASRPLGVRIAWNTGGGHFIVLSAYSWTPTSEQVTVEDPINGPSTLSLADLTTNYLSAGTWTHSYWTL